MAHAETCPVCKGSGELFMKSDGIYVSADQMPTTMKTKICHGCDGKGWVEVGRDDPPVVVPIQSWPPPGPTTYPPYTITWCYL